MKFRGKGRLGSKLYDPQGADPPSLSGAKAGSNHLNE
jgi:hypothetical protein